MNMPVSLPANKDYVTIGQAAKLLGVHIKTLRRWDQAGKITTVRLDGKNRYFSLSQIKKIKEEKPLSISQAAVKLNISVSTLRRMDKRGQLKAERNELGERIYHQKIDKYASKNIISRPISPFQKAYKPMPKNPVYADTYAWTKKKAFTTTPLPVDEFAYPTIDSIIKNAYKSPGLFKALPKQPAPQQTPLYIPTPTAPTRNIKQHTTMSVYHFITSKSVIAFLLFLLVTPVAAFGFIRNSEFHSQQFEQEQLRHNALNANVSQSVLAASTSSESGTLVINIPTLMNQSASVSGDLTVAGTLTAPNVVYSLVAGDGITVSGGQTPTITNTGVLSLGGETGAITLTGGTGISVSGTTITATGVTSMNTLTGALKIAGGGINAVGASGTTITVTGTEADTLATVTGRGATTTTALTLSSSSNLITVGTLTFPSFTSNGGVLYTNGSGVTLQVTAGTAGQCLLGGSTPSFGNCNSGSADAFWDQASGLLFTNNSTVDFAIGGQATTSAKFAVLNVAGGTPTASVSAGTAGATYLTATGTLATTAKQTLTLGTATTGNLHLLPNGGNVGIGTTNPTTSLAVAATNAYIWADGSSAASVIIDRGADTNGASVNFRTAGAENFIIGTGVYATGTVLQVGNGSSPFVTVDGSGNVQIGTTSQATNTLLTLSSTTQNSSRITLSGQEFYAASNTSTDGVALLSGVNRTNNRQLWIADSAALTQNTTNAVIRLLVGGTGTPSIDAMATNGTTNLNLGLQTTGGNVGIGTTVPLTALDITGSASLSANVSFKGAGTAHTFNILDNGTLNIQRSPGGDAGVTSALFIQNNGNVGIGTTGPGNKLHVVGGYTAFNYAAAASQYIGTFQNNAATGDFSRVLILSGTASQSILELGDTDDSDIGALIYDQTANRMDFRTNNATQMSITSAGNVGIGTTVPVAKLQVAGIASASAALYTTGGTTPTTDRGVSISFDGSNGIIRTADWGNNVDNYGMYLDANQLVFSINGTANPKMLLNNDGNLGIGTTSPGSLLEVSGTGTGTSLTGTTKGQLNIRQSTATDDYKAAITFSNAVSNSGNIPFGVIGVNASNSTGSQMYFGTSNSFGSGVTNTAMLIDASGNLGIGATTPLARLHVSQAKTDTAALSTASEYQMKISNPTATTNNIYSLINFSFPNNDINALIGAQLTAYNNGSADLVFGTRNSVSLAEAMRIQGGGNVGIGTTTPVGTLNVHGTVNTQAGAIVNVTTSNDIFTASKSGSPKFVIKNDGNVGIGTTLPSEKLHLAGEGSYNMLASNTIATYDHRYKATIAGTGLVEDFNVGNRPTIVNSANYQGTAWTGWQTGVTPGCSTADSVSSPGSQFKGAALRCIQNSGNGIWATSTTEFISGHVYRISFRYTATAQWYMANRDDRIQTIAANTGNAQYYSFTYTAATCSLGSSCYLLIGADATNTLLIDELWVEDLSNGTFTYNFVADATGNVGIGTASPVAMLDIRNSGTTLTASISGSATVVPVMRAATNYNNSASPTTGFGTLDLFNGDPTDNNHASLDFSTKALNGTNEYVAARIGTLFTRQTNSDTGDIFFATRQLSGGTISERMRIKYDGNVGIGTTAPLLRLDVQDSQNSTAAAQIYNTSTNTDADGLVIKLGNTSTSAVAASNHFLSFETAGIGIVGSVQGNAAKGVSYATSGIADFAEYLRKDANEDVPFGSVMCISTNGNVTKCAEEKGRIVGVASEHPTFVGGENLGNRSIAVGIQGQVMTRVSAQNGPIEAGDYLTSSTIPGVAVKATKPGPTIGKALASYNGSGIDKIIVVVNVGFADPKSALVNLSFDTNGNVVIPNLVTDKLTVNGPLNISQNAVAIPATPDYTNIQTALNQVTAQTNTLDTTVASLSARIAFLEQTASSAVLGASSSATVTSTLQQLTADIATVSGTLNVLGRTTVADLGITGNIIAGVMSIHGLDGEINTLAGDLKLQSNGLNGIDLLAGKVTIDTSGNITTEGEITAKKINIDTTEDLSASVGTGTLPAGETQITISTTAVTANSKIFVTATKKTGNQPLIVSQKNTGSGFVVSIENTYGSDIKFDWWIVN